MLYGASLARQTAALDGGDDVVLTGAFGDAERLVDDQTQGRTCEVNFLVLAIDGDLAGAGLEPYAGRGVLTTTGRVGAAL
ncbi:hypothetical protein NAP1_13163 [Erythrobacter sp. NAP1]|nr:hypothetical protein NAP1_13163 [Erythrobacter sp. NAP1]